jgi:PEP-CTERM motif
MKLHKIAAALALSALAAASQAAPLITNFFSTTHGGFIAGSAVCAAGVTANCDLGTTPLTGLSGAEVEPMGLPVPGVLFNTVSWGIGVPVAGLQSSLQTAHLAGVNLTVNGAAQRIDSFIHNNNVIDFSDGVGGINHLSAVQVFGSVSLTAIPGPGGFPDFPAPPVFGTNYFPGLNPVTFTETLNLGTDAACTAQSGNNPLDSLCDDYFETAALDATALFFIDSAGTKYYIEFGFDNGTAFVEDGVLLDKRIWTRENAQSIVYTTARIFTVPEPTMLGLFGFALVGVALSRRRKLAA